MLRLGMLLMAVLMACASSHGQSLREVAGPFGLPVSAAALERYAGALGLDSEQKQLARTLHQGYRGALRQALKEGNEEIKAMEQTEERANRPNKGMEILDKFAERHEEIERGFFEDLRAILRLEQEARFESVVRARRREVQMRFAFVAGEGVDLIAVLEKLKVEPKAESDLAAHVEDYERAMDTLMIEKQRLMRSSLKRAGKLMKNGLPDFELVGSIIEDLYAIGGRVRDLNRRYVRMIEPMLAEEKREGLVEQVKLLSFPRVYSRTLAHKVLDAAKNSPGLSPKQVEELERLSKAFERDLESVNQRYASAIEETQERFPKDFLQVMQMRSMEDGDDPLVKARAEREELMQSVFRKVKALVGDGEFAKLPQTDPNYNRFPEFLPDLRIEKEWNEFEGEEAGMR